jgi:hypothetical protein
MKWKTHVHCQFACDAQRGFGLYVGLAGRDEREGIRAIRIDAELLSERILVVSTITQHAWPFTRGVTMAISAKEAT